MLWTPFIWANIEWQAAEFAITRPAKACPLKIKVKMKIFPLCTSVCFSKQNNEWLLGSSAFLGSYFLGAALWRPSTFNTMTLSISAANVPSSAR
jgi:hypothetical protein